MIKKDDLKDWLAESERQKSSEAIENFIDSEIKRNVLAGKTSFFIATGRWGKTSSEKTKFHELWYDKELSKENQTIVQSEIIEKYQGNGFYVARTNVDCGWNNSAFALEFKDIDKLVG